MFVTVKAMHKGASSDSGEPFQYCLCFSFEKDISVAFAFTDKGEYFTLPTKKEEVSSLLIKIIIEQGIK